MGNYAKGIHFVEKGIAAGKKGLFSGNYALSWSQTVLGNIYKELGRYEEAKPLLQKTLPFQEKFYGKRHFETAKILRDLGHLSLAEVNMKEVECLFEESLSIFQETKHVDIYTILA